MKETYSAVIKQSGSWWIGWIEEVPGVNCQELTKQELMETLTVTLQEALEVQSPRSAGSGRTHQLKKNWIPAFAGMTDSSVKAAGIPGGIIPLKTIAQQVPGTTRLKPK